MSHRNGHSSRGRTDRAPRGLEDLPNDARPPPSTLAAQIAQSNGHASSTQNAGTATLDQLLDECLSDPDALESDWRANHKLISVIAEAGLRYSGDVNPFDNGIDKALRSLRVIVLAVGKTPGVLFDVDADATSLNIPLCSILIPQILSLLQPNAAQSTIDQVRVALIDIARPLSRRVDQWANLQVFLHFYNGLAQDALRALQASKKGALTDFAIPSAQTCSLIYGATSQLPALPRSAQAIVKSSDQAVTYITVLIAAQVAIVDPNIVPSSPLQNLTGSACLKTMRQALQVYRHATPERQAGGVQKCMYSILESSLSVAEVFADQPGGQFLCQHLEGLLVCTISQSLRLSASTLEPPLQALILATLEWLAARSLRNSALKQTVRQHLWPNAVTTFTRVVGDNDALKRRLDAVLGVLASEDDFVDGSPPSNNAADPMPINHETGRPLKRRKCGDTQSSREDAKPMQAAYKALCVLFSVASDTTWKALLELVKDGFESLARSDQVQFCVALTDLMLLAPQSMSAVGREKRPSPYSTIAKPLMIVSDDSRYCVLDHEIADFVARALTVVCQSQSGQASRELRVQALSAIGLLATCSSGPHHRDLNSPTGKLCLQSLRSSSREIRASSCNALTGFLASADIEDDTQQRNKAIALECLRQMSASPNARYQETVIALLGSIASVSQDDALLLALVKLCEYLGHANPLVSSLADLELCKTAAGFGVSVEEMLRPLWRTIAITSVKDMNTRPQMTQTLSGLLGLTISQFLLLTQHETIPWLVTWKRKDAFERIVKAKGPDASVWSVLMQSKNMSPTLAMLLSQEPDNAEAFIAESLANISKDLKNEDISGLLKSHELPVAFELFKAAGWEQGPAREKLQRAFATLTRLVSSKSHAVRPTPTQLDPALKFLEDNMLGIMASFTEALEGPTTALLEKRRLLRGMKELIETASQTVAVAVPQIRACLQPAMDQPGLVEDALEAWLALLEALRDSAEISTMIQTTLALVSQYWPNFSPSVQAKAHDLVADLVKRHSSVIQDHVEMLPSLSSVPILSKINSQLDRLKSKVSVSKMILAFVTRCQDENIVIVDRSLTELEIFLVANQQWFHESCLSEIPDRGVSAIVRALLNVCSKYHHDHPHVAEAAAKCLGVVGCIDPNRIDAVREKHELVVLSNFEKADEAINFIVFFLEKVLVRAFHSVVNPRAQGFLAYVMQELLKFCGFNKDSTNVYKLQSSQAEDAYQRWMTLLESSRNTLTPFLSSHYVLKAVVKGPNPRPRYPIIETTMSHAQWLSKFVQDVLLRSTGTNATMIFHLVARIIKGFDASIPSCLLPYVLMNVVLGGTAEDVSNVKRELAKVLEISANDLPSIQQEQLKLCSENVFEVLDYFSKWLQLKKSQYDLSKNVASRSNRTIPEAEQKTEEAQIASVEGVLNSIPAGVISSRAMQCDSHTRALLHWEDHIRQTKGSVLPAADIAPDDPLFGRLQQIYGQIDEPDGIEGLASHFKLVDPEVQATEHQRAGRWEVAHAYYENKLLDNPNDTTTNVNLLNCLQRAGRYQIALRHAETLDDATRRNIDIEEAVAEALCLSTPANILRDADGLVPQHSRYLTFNAGFTDTLKHWLKHERDDFDSGLVRLRSKLTAGLNTTRTSSTQACHDHLLKLHALYEVDLISGLGCANGERQSRDGPSQDLAALMKILDRRLDVVGSSTSDKQYLLGIRRAIMRGSGPWLNDSKALSENWLTSARLARKAGNLKVAWDGALEAHALRNSSAQIEEARLLWKSGEQRKAIESLQATIAASAFELNPSGVSGLDQSMSTIATGNDNPPQSLLAAKAYLLLAKWLDQAGQTQSAILNAHYQQATRVYTRWEKGLYYLGRFYNKLLDSDKRLPVAKQSLKYLSGETAKLVIENYLRSLIFGCKYLPQTLPKLLTLWLDFGNEATKTISREVHEDVRSRAHEMRPKVLDVINKQMKKYGDKIASYLLYTALPQMITRVGHSNAKVYDVLVGIILRVASSHPQQALWSLLAVVKSSAPDRTARGFEILKKLKERGKSIRHENNNVDLKTLVTQAQKLSDQLLHASEVAIDARSSTVSLSRELGFSMKIAPSPLVVPFEKHLSASLPATNDSASLKAHRAFPMSREATTIASFQDEVSILSSLQRPRKITLRGSDGVKYGLLCKPHDDLRKDQRLMEFNAMINRLLKKDDESTKRRLYIRTYAVVPLNEACGIIEWVDGLRPMRDILLHLYRSRGVKLDYPLVRGLLTEACRADNPDGWKIFTERIMPMYPPVLHEWFTDVFPAPDAWFAARLRYVRSCAVASMVGYALGLGDRHGENLLLEENTGGVFHVDFNCLFDKGLTFEKPEVVPFRLTQNMVDAFGAYGVEGPWRKAAELAMGVMRGNEDALLTILETFVYDPTADFVGPRKRPTKGVPETPKDVLESVGGKVRGLMRGDNVPLSVQGHVDALVRQATDPKNLCAMYIGWCAFL